MEKLHFNFNSSKWEKILLKLNNFEYGRKWFYINLNWFSSWFFCLPLFTYNFLLLDYITIDYQIIKYGVLYPSLIRHTHFTMVSEIICNVEKWIIRMSILILFFRRINYLFANGVDNINIFDLGLNISIFTNIYIYFIANLSYSKYGVLWHCFIHLSGALGLVCTILSY